MPPLKYYYAEADRFRVAANIKLYHDWAVKVAKKIARHFKVKCNVEKKPSRNTGHAWYYDIQLPKEPSLLMVCHEVAHLYEQQKRSNCKHNKKLMTTVKRMVQFALKNWASWIAIQVGKV
jgi:hypothetical protein